MSPLVRVLLAVIGGYRRWISPLIGPHCRFAPSCSAYATQALAEYGAMRGGGLALRRLARCHPFQPGGHDPVPARPSPPSSIMEGMRPLGARERTPPRPGARPC